MKLTAIVLASSVVAATAPALAHHSFAMFDGEKKVTLEGTVKDFQWTNPHSWIMLTVLDDAGQPQLWAIEMGGPGGLARQGWASTTLNPLKDGSNGGQFMAITLPDGTQMGNANGRANANAGAGGVLGLPRGATLTRAG
jgi:hypothetical protein